MKSALKLVVSVLMPVAVYSMVMPAAAEITFKRAEASDIAVLMNFYSAFTEGDKRCVLVDPRAERQEERFAKDVRAQRFFIAYANAEPVAMLKLYRVSNAELSGIEEELGIVPGKDPEVTIYDPEANNFSIAAPATETDFGESIQVYVGSQYTVSARREISIQSMLLHFALDQVLPSRISDKLMVLFYGQAGTNIDHKGPARAFYDYVDCRCAGAGKGLIGKRMRYPTCKPEIDDAGAFIFPPGTPDRGNVFCVYPENRRK
jgi:hypothetical protein